MYRCSKLVCTDVQPLNVCLYQLWTSVYISNLIFCQRYGRKSFSHAGITAGHTHFLARHFFVAIKIFHRTKCPSDRKLCRTKPNVEFFSQTNLQCPVLFQGLIFDWDQHSFIYFYICGKEVFLRILPIHLVTRHNWLTDLFVKQKFRQFSPKVSGAVGAIWPVCKDNFTISILLCWPVNL